MTVDPHQTTRRGLFGAGAAAAATALGLPETAFGADRPNVILIVVDSLRADHVYGDRARTPEHGRARPRRASASRSAYPEAMPTVPARNSILSGRRHFPFRGWHD